MIHHSGTNTPATPRERTIRKERGRQAREGAGIQAQADLQVTHFRELGWYVPNGCLTRRALEANKTLQSSWHSLSAVVSF